MRAVSPALRFLKLPAVSRCAARTFSSRLRVHYAILHNSLLRSSPAFSWSFISCRRVCSRRIRFCSASRPVPAFIAPAKLLYRERISSKSAFRFRFSPRNRSLSARAASSSALIASTSPIAFFASSAHASAYFNSLGFGRQFGFELFNSRLQRRAPRLFVGQLRPSLAHFLPQVFALFSELRVAHRHVAFARFFRLLRACVPHALRIQRVCTCVDLTLKPSKRLSVLCLHAVYIGAQFIQLTHRVRLDLALLVAQLRERVFEVAGTALSPDLHGLTSPRREGCAHALTVKHDVDEGDLL